TKAPLGEPQPAQQVLLVWTAPPAAWHPAAEGAIRQRTPQSPSFAQAAVASSAHVPDVVWQALTGTLHATASGRPHADRAAQRTTLPLQPCGTSPSPARRFSACATQRTYAPWLVAGSHGHLPSTAARAAQRAASQPALPCRSGPPPCGLPLPPPCRSM